MGPFSGVCMAEVGAWRACRSGGGACTAVWGSRGRLGQRTASEMESDLPQSKLEGEFSENAGSNIAWNTGYRMEPKPRKECPCIPNGPAPQGQPSALIEPDSAK